MCSRVQQYRQTKRNCAYPHSQRSRGFLSQQLGIDDANAGQLPVEAVRDSKLVLDGSAYAVLQTQEVYNSSNLLESIQNANVLYNILVDLQTSMGSRLTGSSILGIGATGVNSQMWNKYHGATQSGITDNKADQAFNEVVSRLGTIYCGLNILSASRDAGGAEVNTVVAETQVVAGPAVENFKAPFAGYPGPIYMDTVYGPIGPAVGNDAIFKGQLAALDAGAGGVDGFISRLGPVIRWFHISSRPCDSIRPETAVHTSSCVWCGWFPVL
jgi:hypothetical protein